MSKPNELTGLTFGTLTVGKRAFQRRRDFFWYCQCSCGAKLTIRGAHLTGGKTKSCGCVHGVQISKPITHEQLLTILRYERSSGLFFWKIKSRKYDVGDVAGKINTIGYVILNINNTPYLAHMLASFYVNGVWPDHEIDHWDRDRSNNRWKNLRPCNRNLSSMNSTLSKANTSGFKGVAAHGERFRAYCRGKHIGVFNTAVEAARAYDKVAYDFANEYAALNFEDERGWLESRKKVTS